MSVMTLRAVILVGMLLFAVALSTRITMMQALTLYDSGDPTDEEQLSLEYINRARANPIAEGTRLGMDMWESLCDLNSVGVRPPLAMNKMLLQVAEYHSWDMYNSNYFAHNDLSGHDPEQRMSDAGYGWRTWGENIAVGSSGYNATNLEDELMVDSGTSCRLHRINLFDRSFKEVGVGYYAGAIPNPSGWSSFLTQDFGSTSVGPFLVGVVYKDADGDSFYDIGEGISGVQIMPSEGSYYAVSSTSGGYAFPIGISGVIAVTASGSGLDSITKTVSFTGANIKLDFVNTSDNATTQTTIITSTTSTTGSTSATMTTVAVTVSASTSSSNTTLSTSFSAASTTFATSTASSTMTSSATTLTANSPTATITFAMGTNSSTATTSATEISEFQFEYAVLLIVVVGLYAMIRRKPQPA